MRIELDQNEVVVMAQAFRGNGPTGIRYTMLTRQGIRHFHDFEELIKVLKEHFKIRQEPT